MKVLVYGNRKTEDVLYDVSTPAKRGKAFLKVFRLLDKEWDVYSDLDEPDLQTREARWKDLRDKARAGDAEAAEALLMQRSRLHYEYEQIHFTEVTRL